MKKLYNLAVGGKDLNLTNKQGDKDWIRITERGDFHMGVTSNWDISSADIARLNIKNVDPIKNPILLQNKKIYRYPKLDLPRQKVDLLKEKFDVKVTRDLDKADICVTSYKHIKDMFHLEWADAVSFREFYSICIDMKEQNLLTEFAVDQLRNLLPTLDKDGVVFLPRHHYYGQVGEVTDWYIKFMEITEKRKIEYADSSRSFVLRKEDHAEYQNLLDLKANLVFDHDICNIIDKDLAVLDNIEYDSIESMITNSEVENRTLALEMLANCNLHKSFDVVSGIFYWNYEWCKASTNWNTVNVKTLRKRMQAYQGDHPKGNHLSYDRYIKALREDNKLTEFAINKTRMSLYKNVLGNIIGEDADIFSVDFENLKLKNK
jgi:hypothetical protein|tara:strand:- start:3104 stop:4231 length:1128 start_codon:yes stop_codon:yes gene_type:complete